MSYRAIITGVGVVSPLGIGKDEFWNSLLNYKSGITPITKFDVSSLNTKLAGQNKNFNAAEYTVKKGLKYLNKSTIAALVASKLAILDSKIEISKNSENDLGLIVGSSKGHLETMSKIMKDISDNPAKIGPMDGPSGVVNIVSSHLAIRHQIKGFNTTVSNGDTSGIDALIYGYNLIKAGRSKIMIVGGVESLCYEQFLSFYRTNRLSKSEHSNKEISSPFDKKRNGFVLSEGSAFFVLEEYEHAKSRNAKLYGEIKGYGKSFCISKNSDHQAEELFNVMKTALEKSKCSKNSIDYLSAAGNSGKRLDKVESKSINLLFKDKNKKPALPVSSIKGALGECCCASAPLQTVAALASIKSGIIPPMVNYKTKDPDCDLNFVTKKTYLKNISNVLINQFTLEGNMCSIVVSQIS